MPEQKVKKILFVCVGNTCRSQMAEGFARRYGEGRVEARSAGTSAAGYVSKSTVRAMEEIGIDISSNTSKQLTEDMIEWADVVVTLGCAPAKEFCSPSHACEQIDWKVGDPLGRPWDEMQRVRDDIEKKVRELVGG